MGVATRMRVFGLQGFGERHHCLSVRVLQETPLSPLHFDDAAKVARVDEQLLGVGLRSADDELCRQVVELVDERDQVERAERLAENRSGACGSCLSVPQLGPGQQDHGRLTVGRSLCQPSAKGQPVHAGKGHVEENDGGSAETRSLAGLLCGSDLFHLELVGSKRRPEQEPQRRVVVDDENPPARRPRASRGCVFELSLKLRRVHGGRKWSYRRRVLLFHLTV